MGFNGVLLYDGVSLLNGKKIIVVATGLKTKSTNPKTKDMIQTYILCKDVDPIKACATGKDDAICGDCKHRRVNNDSCYVNIGQAPLQVYKAYKAGQYPKFHVDHLQLFRNKHVRLGTYGDPAAVPMDIWYMITSIARDYTGYTHQYKNCDPALRHFCVASVDTDKEYVEAVKLGWKPFRIAKIVEDVKPTEFICPASKEGGLKTTCAKCCSCNGGIYNGKDFSPVIILHGPAPKIKHFKEKVA